MGQSLLRGLQLLEAVDFHGLSGVTELANRLGVDKATVSRMVTACVRDGWLERHDGKVCLGPRSSMLGQGDPAASAVRAAQPLVATLSGVTGLMTHAVALIGRDVVVMASAGAGTGEREYGLTTKLPLWAGAAGKSIAAQLPDSMLDDFLPPEPFPDPLETYGDLVSPAWNAVMQRPIRRTRPTTLARTRAEFDAQLAQIRRDSLFLDVRELTDQTTCLGIAWPRPRLVAALVCIAVDDALPARRDEIARCLRAAAAPGADRESIVAAASS